MSGVKHFKDDDQANGSLSPSKMAKIEGEGEKDGERLTRVMGYFSPGKEPPVIKPKPKPKTRPRPVRVVRADRTDGPSTESPGTEDPGPIKLNTDSLVQFGEVVDLDAVVRYQMLDNTPQKDRAALSQSKGLKDRRLPSHVATLIGDDRPPPRQPVNENKRPRPQPQAVDEPDIGTPPMLTEEEKRQKLMAKAGISQANPLAALGNILRKGSGRGSGRDSKSPRRESPVTKKSSFKGSKESLRDGAKDSPEPSRRTSEPKSPRMFRFGIRRSSSRSKKGDLDDAASDTASVNSLNFVSVVKEEPMETESSRLTVSRSAVENGSLEKEKAAENTALASAAEDSKSGNRNSTYFKPTEVEPLSDLFASGELAALLSKSSAESEDNPTQAEAEKPKEKVAEKKVEVEVEKKVQEEDEEERGGSGLKRNNLRSSFRMYESRYKAETLEKKKKDKSPLSASASAEKPSFDKDLLDSKASETVTSVSPQVPTSTPKSACKQDKKLLDADDDADNFKKEPPLAATSEDGKKATDKKSSGEEKQKDNERRRRQLFDDELFQSDLSTQPQSRPKKTSAMVRSLDAYAHAHKSPPPVAAKVSRKRAEKKSDEAVHSVFGESLDNTEVGKKKSNEPRLESEKQKSPVVEESIETEDVDFKSDKKQTDSSSTEKTKEIHQPLSSDGVAGNDNESMPVTSVAELKESVPSPLASPTKAIEKTELEKESEKRESDKELIKKKTEPERMNVAKPAAIDSTGTTVDTIVDETVTNPEKHDTEPDIKISPQKSKKDEGTPSGGVTDQISRRSEERAEEKSRTDEETPSERVTDRIRKRREETEEQKPKTDEETPRERVTDRIRKRKEEREEQKSKTDEETPSERVADRIRKRREEREEQKLKTDEESPSERVANRIRKRREEREKQKLKSDEESLSERVADRIRKRREEREKQKLSHSPCPEKEADQEKMDVTKQMDSTENIMDRASDETKQEKHDNEERNPLDIQESPQKTKTDKETQSEKVAERIRKRREEREEQKSSRSTRSYDSRSKIESGKVSNARSRFDTGSPSSSPRMSRARASTDAPRLATERKTTARVKESSEDGEEDVPEWRKRMMERRKKAAEASAKTSSIVSQSDRSKSSPRLGRRGETSTSDRVSTRVDKSPRRDLSSAIRKSPSPSKKTTESTRTVRSRMKEKSETMKKSGDEMSKLEETDSPRPKEEQKATSPEKEEKISTKPDLTVDTHQKTSLSEEPEITSPKPGITSPKPKVTSPKPEITSPKPKIELISRRVVKTSSSKPVKEKGSSVEVKPSEAIAIDDVDKEKKVTDEDEVFKPVAKKPPTTVSKDLRSSSPQLQSNLPSQVLADSQGGSGSRRSSTSSEQEGGVPFRSRSFSHSRSPTPTSQTAGPLKLPADPGVPDWKMRVLERKKSVGSSKKVDSTSHKKSEPEVPLWKKELLAKRGKSGEESKLTSRLRSGTAPTRPLSTRSGRKKDEPVPEFMKEFKNKKKSTT